MNILLINGSPKGKRSNSLRLANSFIAGIQSAHNVKGEEITLEELDVASLKIGACLGCFSCWQRTPGQCCIKDDMQMVIEKEVWADLIVWSFPLYYFNVPGILKNLIDRQLPMNLPFMSKKENEIGSGGHDARYEMKARHILISTCGFYSSEGNYDSVKGMFNHFLGRENYETIFCGQGELFRVKELSARTDEYLETVKRAGTEYAAGAISEATKSELQVLLYPKEVFEEMADASWGVSKDTGEKEAADLIFTRQMAALYNKNAYDGKDRVLEMHYTDLGTTYQILLGENGSKVYTDGSLTATTHIDTSFETWSAISRGEIAGAEALGKGMYTVSGDFSLMIDWDKFFRPTSSSAAKEQGKTEEAGPVQGKPSMTTMLIPWIAFWIALSIDTGVGALITMAVCAVIPLLMRKHGLVIWDQLSLAAVAILAAIGNVTGNGNLVTNIGYLVFGLFWLGSCFFHEPLCATYVKYNYGGDKAYQNPLFMETNTILAACWGALYLLTAVWTFFLRRLGVGSILILLNNIVPAVMGAFTVWFEKWYPAWKASGKGKRS